MDARQADAGFADPGDYDFAVVHLTDTQYIAEGAADATDPERQARFRAAQDAIGRWVAENAGPRKIVYLAHTGDLVENWCWFWNRRSTARAEFKEARRLIKTVEAAGVPVGVLPGNHDNRWGSDEGHGSPELTMFNRFFGPPRSAVAARKWRPSAGDLPVQAHYGGPWRPLDNSCHVDLVDVGELRLVFLHLGYGVRDEHVSWANRMLERHADRDAVICTHHYLDLGTNPDGSGAQFGGPGSYGADDGEKIHREIVSRNANVVMVLCGHVSGTGWVLETEGGHRVTSVLADYQAHRLPDEQFPAGYEEPDGDKRTGFLRLLQFRVADGSVRITTYSPVLDSFAPADYAPQVQVDAMRSGGRAAAVPPEQWVNPDHLILPVDLRSHLMRNDGLPHEGGATGSPGVHTGGTADTTGRAVPDPWGTALTLAGAVGAAVVGRWMVKRR